MGGTIVFDFFLFLEPSPSTYLFSFSPFVFFLLHSFFLLITWNSAARQFPSLVYICIRLGQTTSASAHRCNSNYPADSPSASLPAPGLEAFQLSRHHSTLALINPGICWWSCNAFRAWQVSLFCCAVRDVTGCYSSLSQISLHYTL